VAPRSARRAIFVLLGVIAAAIAFVTIRSSFKAATPGAALGGPSSNAVAPVGRRVPAPELHPSGFLNTEPLSLAQLRGKVVLVDFWTYTCINCQRTFPVLRSWWDRYRDQGLVILGVHSPEFDFERDPTNVAQAVKRYQVTWPVVLDPDMATWNAYSNRYWPADYLIDREGRVASVHYGEGDYLETEQAIRALLAEGNHPLTPPEPNTTEPPSQSRQDETPEIYAGYERGTLANGYAKDQDFTYKLPPAPPTEGFAIGGPWHARSESIDARGPGAEVVLRFTARLVHMVASGSGDVVVTLNGQPVPPDQRPPGMTVRPDGATIVHVEASDLYTVLSGPEFRSATLDLRPQSPFSLFSFTFGA
jgi:thiol-disulfide isomerase/thioredoxin